MKNFIRLLAFAKPYWKASAAAILLLTLVVVTDLAIPRLIQSIIDDGILQTNMSVIIKSSLSMLAISATGMVLAIGNTILSVRVGEAFSRDLREALFLKVQSLSFANLDKLKTGQIIIRLTSDVNTTKMVMQMFLRIGTRAPLLLIGSGFLLVWTSPRLTLMMVPVILLMLVLIVWAMSKIRPMFLDIQQRLDHLNNVLQENLAGVRVVKAFVRGERENERFEDANTDLMNRTIRMMEYMSAIMPGMMFLINLGVVIAIWGGGVQVINGSQTIGEIVAFTNYLMIAMFPLIIMAMIVGMSATAEASAERINEVLDDQPAVQQPEDPKPLDDLQGKVEFENVSFSYFNDGSEPVLQEINLTAEPGQTIAVLGATGNGKSTLVNLIPRFYDVSEGRILIDDVDIRELDQDALLAQTGIALQDTVLFSESVRDNIRYGRPEATDEEVIAAAKAAQAHDFITELAEGYDAQISERGTNLSGGQKQRIAIARAMLVNPRILILDDSTSAVDVETETKIQAALDELMAGRTSFVVAQRISTVLNADKIIVLDRGRIVAEGTHDALIKDNAVYQEIYESQLGSGVVQNG
jgi:ATP-binding cassette, subfamily B, multidrug efflux pump